jgi:hypothetical protein
MVSHFRTSLVLLVLISFFSVCGCSYQILRAVEGSEVSPPSDKLQVGASTLGEALSLLGAPDQVVEMEGQNILIYERGVLHSNRLTIGIPVVPALRSSARLSAYAGLVRYDSLALFFVPDGTLSHLAFTKGSDYPFVKILVPDVQKGE